jgi:rRNA maturation RNase YbeY
VNVAARTGAAISGCLPIGNAAGRFRACFLRPGPAIIVPMRIVIANRQRAYGLDSRELRLLLTGLAGCAQRACRQPPWRELTVLLTDDAGMAPFNQAIMRHDGPTDVITQRYETLPGEPAGLIGELIVNVERAWQVGRQRRAWSPGQELALYLAHGCDHLNGADDASPADRQRMRRRELGWLRRLGAPHHALLRQLDGRKRLLL